VVRTFATTSRREAKSALAKLETEVAAGKVSFDDPTLTDLLNRWMDHITSVGRAPTTLYHCRQYIDREIAPVLGAIRLSKLTALDIDRLYGQLRKRDLAPATIRQIHAILRASLNQAERCGLVQRNAARLASAPSQSQRERAQL
jgi:integrase